MSPLALEDPAVAALVGRLAPYARRVLERAAETACRLHAETVGPEHLLTTLLRDETAAGTRVVLHAFADPETLSIEALALCPGILVVASGRSLPFSIGAVHALEAAHAVADAAGEEQVEPDSLLSTALAELAPELRSALAQAGCRAPDGEGPASPGEERARAEPLFRRFSPAALRALGAACRAAARLGRDAIAPAHLVLGVLEEDAGTGGLDAHRARLVLAGRDEDPTPPAPRAIALDGALVEILRGAGIGADTASLLERILTHGSEELRLLLVQQRVTPALLERSRGAFRDPEEADAEPG